MVLLAVLPFTEIVSDGREEYFADGMTEELITELAKVSSVRVISRTSVMQYKKSVRSVPDLGRELHVDALIEGTVRRSGDRVRITIKLVEDLARAADLGRRLRGRYSGRPG